MLIQRKKKIYIEIFFRIIEKAHDEIISDRDGTFALRQDNL